MNPGDTLAGISFLKLELRENHPLIVVRIRGVMTQSYIKILAENTLLHDVFIRFDMLPDKNPFHLEGGEWGGRKS